MSQQRLTSKEIQFLQEALSSDYIASSIRLREGEHQYNLAKTIASFNLELYFPNVKDIVERLFGEDHKNDVQFIRKIQTILKKMEKGNILKILPKKKPWDLQRYGLLSFKFHDIDKNPVVLATDEQIKFAETRLQSMVSQHLYRPIKTKILGLIIILLASYTVIVWNFVQTVINPLLFIFAFIIATVSSLLLGETLSKRE
ncbi:MAG: hypothetical protein QW279_06800 [Candidatus Jordarchaeaceae archaeon]